MSGLRAVLEAALAAAAARAAVSVRAAAAVGAVAAAAVRAAIMTSTRMEHPSTWQPRGRRPSQIALSAVPVATRQQPAPARLPHVSTAARARTSRRRATIRSAIVSSVSRASTRRLRGKLTGTRASRKAVLQQLAPNLLSKPLNFLAAKHVKKGAPLLPFNSHVTHVSQAPLPCR